MIVVNTLLGIAGGWEYLAFRRAAAHPRRSAAKTLRRILSYARDSVYGKEHDFAWILQAKDADELFRRYQEKVPAQEYSNLEPYIERHKSGEADVLFPGKPVIYSTTSGTTAQPKWIPVTMKSYTDVVRRRMKAWLFLLIKKRPLTFSGSAFSIVGKTVEGHAPDGTPFGAVSGYFQGHIPAFIRNLYSFPACVFSISDYNARYYVMMRLGIEQDVTILASANPSTIVELQKNVNKYLDEYLKDIENGTISDIVPIEPEIRARLEPLVKPNPRRAARLRALKQAKGELLIKDYWPRFQLITTWKCGNTRIYLDEVSRMLPKQTAWLEFSYYSSECDSGLVMDDGVDTCVGTHLHYLEFVAEEELGTPNPRFFQIYELEQGRRYCPFVTTYSGLYRYNMNDVVEVGGKFRGIPTFHLVGKTGGVVSITGEKLSENQFFTAVKKAARDCAVAVPFFVGFLDLERKGYCFYYEFAKDVSEGELNSFNETVDSNLKALNMEYASKRDSLRLGLPEAFVLQPDAFRRFKARMTADGARDGQFKLNLLSQDSMRQQRFRELVKA